eukprot:354873-Chlamydomonas_euryale.AAC.12
MTPATAHAHLEVLCHTWKAPAWQPLQHIGLQEFAVAHTLHMWVLHAGATAPLQAHERNRRKKPAEAGCRFFLNEQVGTLCTCVPSKHSLHT